MGKFNERGQIEGKSMGILKYPSKDQYEGDFKELYSYEGVCLEVPQMNGVGKLQSQDGSCYLGDFVDGVFQGEGQYSFADQEEDNIISKSKYQGSFLKG